jgi:hypothetical protein
LDGDGSGLLSNDSSTFQVVAVQKEVQTGKVHFVRLRKRQSLTNEPRKPLPDGVVKALDVIG